MRIKHLLTSLLTLALAAPAVACAQISLSTAVDLALRNSPRVKMAQADLAKAKASLSEARDAFIPQISTNGGYGRSTGAPLSVPVVYSISPNSLVFTFSQPDYIRSARAGVEATEHALAEAQIEVSQDTTNTYVAVENGLRRRDILRDEREIAGRLVDVTNERLSAGIDVRMESTKAKRTATQIKLQSLLLDDEISGNITHLAELTGVSEHGLTTDRTSVPQFARPVEVTPTSDTVADSQGVAAAFAIAKARQLTAFGDRRYLLRPQFALQANYSRVDTSLSSYNDYYPRFEKGPDGTPHSNNSFGFGVAVTIPLLDMVQRARARGTAAEAARAFADATQQRALFREGRVKLRNATLELDARAELARLDQEMAQEQLDALHAQLQADAANLADRLATPKDELNARLQERQKSYDVLSAELQLQQTQVNLLRQQGGLGDWIHSSISNLAPADRGSGANPQMNIPAPPGSSPVAPVPTPLNTPTAAPPGTLPTSTPHP